MDSTVQSPRFTIRDLIWLTLVVAVLFGWLVDHGNLVQRLEDCESRNTRLWQRLREYDDEVHRLDPDRAPRSIP
jgi:hypothetical protein